MLLVAGGFSAACADRRAPETAADRPGGGPTPEARGEERARGDIAAGKMRLYVYGDPAAPRGPERDAGSGLPVLTLPECCVSPEQREETAAYNRVMREAAARDPGLAR